MPRRSKNPIRSKVAFRGGQIHIHDDYLKLLNELWRQFKTGVHPLAGGKKHTLTDFGKILAKRVKRPQAYSDASLSRFLKGKQMTSDILDAICDFFKVPYPVYYARDLNEAEWFSLARTLPKGKFEAMLAMGRTMREGDEE